jgi:hypothetical protein
VWSTDYMIQKTLTPDAKKVPEILPVLAAKAEKALAVLEKVLLPSPSSPTSPPTISSIYLRRLRTLLNLQLSMKFLRFSICK